MTRILGPLWLPQCVPKGRWAIPLIVPDSSMTLADTSPQQRYEVKWLNTNPYPSEAKAKGGWSVPLIKEVSLLVDQPARQLSIEEQRMARGVLREKLKSRRWRLDNLYYIINEKGEEIKFKMNLAQKILFLGLWFFNIVLKSRQHGITTFACIFFLDHCLFNSNITAGIIAHNKEDAKEFFYRCVKHPYTRLPTEIKDALPAIDDNKLKLSFPNGSSVRVTTSGRSGVFQLLHVSELGKLAAHFPEKAREIKTGSLNAIHAGQIVIIESTAEGREGLFWDLCKQAQNLQKQGTHLTVMDPKLFFFGWFSNRLNQIDPAGVAYLDYQTKYFEKIESELNIKLTERQKAWYVKKWNVQGDDMKREHPSTFEEGFEAAIMGAYYATQFAKIRKEGRITKVPFQEDLMVDTWWDLGVDDSTAIWFTQNVGREIHIINYYENTGEGLLHYKNKLDELQQNKGYRYRIFGAPHDIMEREWITGKSRLKSAQTLGINFTVADKLSIESGIEQVRRVLNICIFDEQNCTQKLGDHLVGIPSLESYRKEWNEALQSYRNQPLHDWASHGADAFRTMAVLHEFGALAGMMAMQAQPGTTGVRTSSGKKTRLRGVV